MSEHIKGFENDTNQEVSTDTKEAEAKLEHLQAQAETAKSHKHEHEKAAREEAEKHAKEADETDTHLSEVDDDKGHVATHVWRTKEIKAQAFSETMAQTRKHLSGAERKFSKLIHRPVIEKASDLGAKTIARPYSLLIGGFVALLGTTTALVVSRRLGTPIPRTVFFALFIGGFAVGLLLEALARVLRLKNKS